MFASCTTLSAQDSTVVTIKAGKSVRDVLTAADLFLYPQFVNGKVLFRDGSRAAAMMNYHILFAQVLFIDPKGDTLALNDEQTVRWIALDKDTFYYDKGYVRVLTGEGPVKLGERQVWEVADIRKIGSHNRQANTFSVTSYRTLTDGFGRTLELVMNEDVLLRRRTYYYFGDAYNHFVPAGKKNLLAVYPEGKKTLSHYLDDHKVDFHNRGDLEKVIHFLNQ